LQDFGYQVIEKNDCKFKRELRDHPDLKNYVDNHPLTQNEPLNPRAALYGGRTNGTRLYHKCNGEEEIHFVDIVSLYPKVLCDFKVPVGVPTIHIGPEFPSLLQTEGLVKCLIQPPQK
jgi:hypothetical protein